MALFSGARKTVVSNLGKTLHISVMDKKNTESLLKSLVL